MKRNGYGALILCICILTVPVFTSGTAEKKNQNQAKSSQQDIKNKKDTKPKDTKSTSTPSKYTGERGNFIFHDAELKNVLIFFARMYKLNIIIDPGVSGKVTCRLIDVPWDQALDLILRQNGMMLIKEGKGKALSFRKIDK